MEAHPLEANLWAMNLDFARIPGATVHDDPTLLWYSLPGSNSWLNGASRCDLGDDAEDVIAEAVAVWQGLGSAAMWHQTPSSRPEHLPELLASRGFEGHGAPGMMREVGGTLPAAPPELAVEEVVDRAGVLDWVNTFDAAFGAKPRGEHHPWLAAFAALYLDEASPGRLFLGRVEAIPVATSLGFVGGGAVGLYGVGTVPEWRGHGYGSALTVAGMEWGAGRGAPLAVLEATEPGFPVYERLGFRTVFDTTSWVRPADPAPR